MSGNQNDVAQGIFANQPLSGTASLNGHPAVSFSGSSYLSVLNNSSLDLISTTVFVVGQQEGGGTTANTGYAMTWSGSQVQFGINGAQSTVSGSLAPGTWNDLEGYCDGGATLQMYENGRLSSSHSVPGIEERINGDGSPLFLGARNGGSGGLNGNVAEAMVFNHGLGDADRGSVELYLSNGPTIARRVPAIGKMVPGMASRYLTACNRAGQLSLTN